MPVKAWTLSGAAWASARKMFGPRYQPVRVRRLTDRKSTRLNSSHVEISYAVFCLKKKNDHVLSASGRGEEIATETARAPEMLQQLGVVSPTAPGECASLGVTGTSLHVLSRLSDGL